MISLRKLFEYRLYYAQVILHRLQGKANMDMRTNGEFNVLRRLIGRNSYVIDVGCNIGGWISEARRVSTGEQARFLAVDANSNVLEALRHKFQGDKRVSVRHCAISDFVGKANLWRDANNMLSTSNSLYRHYYLVGGGSVDVVTLDVILSELRWPRVDFLKLDIEGSEVPALRGGSEAMNTGAIRYIQFEYSNTWIKAHTSLEDVFDICSKTGYRAYRILPKGLTLLEEYHYLLDDFVYANILLVAPGLQVPLSIRKNTLPSFNTL